MKNKSIIIIWIYIQNIVDSWQGGLCDGIYLEFNTRMTKKINNEKKWHISGAVLGWNKIGRFK